MKRIISITLTLLLVCACFASCKKTEENAATEVGKRKLYNYEDFSKYVTLGEYKGIEVDKSSDTFKNYTESFFQHDVQEKNLFVKRTTGTVAKGDYVNFDYDGKKKSDGTAIDKNTTDLVIGSGQFIPGFEDNLVGKKVGDSFSFDITFPADYGVDDLNGQVATFAIKINHVNDLPKKDDNFAKSMGFKNIEEYNKDIEKRVIKELIAVDLFAGDKCKIISYPESEKKRYDERYDKYIKSAEDMVASYKQQGQELDVDTVLYSQIGYSAAGLKEYFESNLKRELITYAIFDKEKLKYTQKEFDEQVKVLAEADEASVEEYSKNEETLKYVETNLVLNTVMDYLYDQAKIK